MYRCMPVIMSRSSENMEKKMFRNCRLCLAKINDSNVTLLEGIIKDMLEIILPELNFSICQSPAICKGCLDTLKQAYSYKSSCLEVEDKVQDFVTPKIPSLINLKEVIKKVNNLCKVEDGLVVCRTCLGLGEESMYTKLCSYDGDPLQNMVEKCLPEMGLDLTLDPSICTLCLEQLEEQFHFIMQCLDTEAKINYYSERKHIVKDVDLHNVYLFSICLEQPEEADKSDEALDRSLKLVTEETITECIDLTDPPIKSKIEESETKCKPNLFPQTSQIKKEQVTFEIGKDANGEDIITTQTAPINESSSESDVSVTKESELMALQRVTSAFPCDRVKRRNRKEGKNKTEAKYKEDESEQSEEEFNKRKRRTSKCKLCIFKTKFPRSMKMHMTRYHKEKILADDDKPSNNKVFKCRSCTYKTEEEAEFINHKQTHKKEREKKCPYCQVKFLRPDFLEKHIEQHTKEPKDESLTKPKKSTPNISMTNQKNMFRFNGQVLKMYKCRLCPYQTRLKSNYDKHAMSHKKITQIVTHKCKVCSFETIQKENFMAHMQTHDNETEKKVMKCFLCSFQPSTEQALKQHVNQVHKSGTG